MLGGRLGSLYGDSGSSSLFLDLEARRDLGAGWSATLAARGAAGPISPAAASRAEPMPSTSPSSACMNGGDRLGLRLSQPLRIERGGIAMMLPTGYDYATASETNSLSRLSFTPSGRELDAELSYSTLLGDGWLGDQPVHPAAAGACRLGRRRHGRGDPLQPRLLIVRRAASRRPMPGISMPTPAAIILIVAAEIADQVALLVADGDQHIDRHADREQQVAVGHVRRRPEGEEEARSRAGGGPLVEQGLAELRRRGGAAAQVEPGLLQAEQLEMIDQEGAEQHDQPAEREQRPEDGSRQRDCVTSQTSLRSAARSANRMISAALASST